MKKHYGSILITMMTNNFHTYPARVAGFSHIQIPYTERRWTQLNKIAAVALACAGAVFVCAGIKAAGKGEIKSVI